MEAENTRVEEAKNCVAKWFDKGRDYGRNPITKDLLAYLEAEAEILAEISFKAGIREVVEWIESNLEEDQYGYRIFIDIDEWQAKLKEWGIE